MTPSSWHEVWQSGRLGFHEGRPNAYLQKHAARWLGGEPRRVLVPLCGKTHDLIWLRDQGHSVTGVELSPIAGEQFHAEQGLVPDVKEARQERVFTTERLRFVVGDVFVHEGDYDAVWDRAAMVALPPSMRTRYVRRLRQLAPGGRLLLSTFSYDPRVMSGPPFSVDPVEVKAAFPSAELLDEADIIDEAPAFRERGHRYWIHRTWLTSL